MVKRYDVVIVGGGAAGLSAALTLARSRRSVVVIDAGAPRNAPAGQVHNYLTRDGTPPGELLAAGRAEVTGYGGEITSGEVTSVRPVDGGGFRVQLAGGGAVLARRLLVTTGLVDELPAVPGLAERWGRDVLHCPYCHGWEVRDRAIGVLATGPFAVHQAQLFRQLSADVTVFQHTAPVDPAARDGLTARGIKLIDGEVTGLSVTADRLTGVRLASGAVLPCQALAVQPRLTARAGFLATLGLHPVDHPAGTHLPADPSGATAIPGVWVAGNVTDPMAQVISAAAAGLTTAAALNADLVDEDIRHAMTAPSGLPAASLG